MASLSPSPALIQLERLGDAFAHSAPARRKRMLVVVNPYASTVSNRLRGLVVHALAGRYEVDAIDTQARDHATDLCRAAAREGYDVVAAFGGDGTVNEVANGLAGSATPLTVLPGGRTNVLCRLLGIPHDIVDATEHMLRLADGWAPRRIDLARVNDRHFTFSSGLGLDASVVRRVDARPRLKARLGQWFYTSCALSTFAREYVVHPPRIDVTAGGETVRGVTALVQNGDPYSYFGRRPLHVADAAALDDGRLAGVVLRRANPIDVPTIATRVFARSLRVSRHRRVTGFTGQQEVRAVSADGRPVALQVDGDHIGSVTEAVYGITPGGLVVAS